MIKILNKLDIEKMYLNILNAVFDKLTAITTIINKKLKVFPLILRTRQGC